MSMCDCVCESMRMYECVCACVNMCECMLSICRCMFVSVYMSVCMSECECMCECMCECTTFVSICVCKGDEYCACGYMRDRYVCIRV